jgi:predicted ATPase
MKLKKIEITHFKGLEHFEFDLCDEDETPNTLTCLLGDNGSGKTTVLQAIALVLSAATRKNDDIASVKNTRVSSLPWNGFISEHAISHSTKIKLALVLEPDEITATQEIFDIWKHYYPNESSQLTKPDELTDITLVYEFGQVKCLEGEAALLELWGRFFVKSVVDKSVVDVLSFSKARDFLATMGGVFWFEQYRNLVTSSEGTMDVALIRQELVNWWAYHNQQYKNGEDLLVELEKFFGIIFPRTQFVGIEPQRTYPTNQQSFFFLLQRGDSKPYDIGEMSSGEQTIFSIFYQFVSMKIARSIILIDEIELHLHPPQQQAFYASLYMFGPDCQFIMTTHSPYLDDVFLDKETVFMERL